MRDPNARYKEGFRALTEKLGRVPDSRDKEWLELHEEYKKGWQTCTPMTSEAVPTAVRPTNAPDTGPSSLTARESVPSAPLSGPGIIANPPPDRTTPEPPNGAAFNSGGAMVADDPPRGPNGGLISVCQSCGHLWERPKQRGRPAYKCLECR